MEIRYSLDFGPILSRLAAPFMPQLSFWFDESSPGDGWGTGCHSSPRARRSSWCARASRPTCWTPCARAAFLTQKRGPRGILAVMPLRALAPLLVAVMSSCRARSRERDERIWLEVRAPETGVRS